MLLDVEKLKPSVGRALSKPDMLNAQRAATGSE